MLLFLVHSVCLFAMDVATGGYWSRTAAEVRKANYSIISSGKMWRSKKKYWRIRVDIPKEIRNKVAEIFQIRFNEGYQDADISINKRVILMFYFLILFLNLLSLCFIFNHTRAS